MNMVEVAHQLKDYVQIMVGSEEEEPFDGWPYDKVLKPLVNRPGSRPKTIAKRIVKEYIKSYRRKGEHVTQSAFNLKRIEEVVEKPDALSQKLISSLEDSDVFNAITSSWSDSPRHKVKTSQEIIPLLFAMQTGYFLDSLKHLVTPDLCGYMFICLQ